MQTTPGTGCKGATMPCLFLVRNAKFSFGIPSAKQNSEHVAGNSESFRVFKTKSTPGVLKNTSIYDYLRVFGIGIGLQ